MDKLEILLDMIEHPERYTEQQITDLLADEEMRKHYDVMVRLRGAYDVKKEEDPPLTLPIREGVVTFENESTLPSTHSTPSLTGRVRGGSALHRIAAIFIAAAFLGGLAWALVPRLRSHHTAEPTELSAPSLTGRARGESALVRFADIRLDSILAVVGRHYGRKVCFRDTLACGLRLHTTWNRTEPLDSLVVTLNEFEVLKLTDERDTLFVESVAKEVEL